MSSSVVKHPAVVTCSMFGVIRPITPTLAGMLNGEVLVSYFVGFLCTPVNHQIHSRPVDAAVSKVVVFVWQSSIVAFVLITSKWFKTERFCKAQYETLCRL